MSDCDVLIDGHFVDLIDDAWRADKLPEDDIEVPFYELADPEADTGDGHQTLKEQELKWTDIMLSGLSENYPTMELPSLGKQCANEQCKQLDFLPLQCRCGQVFCSEHLRSHTQSCEKSRFLTEEELKRIDNVFVCSEEGCKQTSIVPLVCQRCMKHYCIQHRHLTTCNEKSKSELLDKEKERYALPIRQFNEAKARVDEQVENSLSIAKKKPKSSEMATKVQLMKLKGKATGQKHNIPISDRVYFNVNIGLTKQSVPVFVSKTWSLGRAIDAVADKCKLQNNNHKSTEKKLRLFKKGDKREAISSDLSVILGNLISDNVIVDGEELIIEYVDDDDNNL